MKVIVVFEFPEVVDATSPEADEVMQSYFDRFDLRRLEDETGAARVWVEDVLSEGEEE